MKKIMNMKKSIILSFIAGALLFSSCGDRLNITPPNSLYDEIVAPLLTEGDEATIQAMVTAMVSNMVYYFNYTGIEGQGSDGRTNSFQGLDWIRTIQGNDVVLGYNDDADYFAGKNEYDFSTPYTSSMYSAPYWFGYAAGINAANKNLNTLTAEAVGDVALNQDGRARGLLIRAFSYLSLMENFQDAYTNGGSDKLGISWYDKYDPKQTPVARSSAKETYEKILADINEAITLLEKAGVGYTDGYENMEDFDLGVANFLLARASLEFGDYSTAIKACNDIISSGKYGFIAEANYGGKNTGADWTGANVEFLPETNAFVAMSVNPEVILGYSRKSSYLATVAFSSFANPFGTGLTRKGFARVDDRLYNQINADDFRKDLFYTSVIGDYTNSTPSTIYVPDWCGLKYATTAGLTDDGTGHQIDASNAPDKAKVGANEYCKFRLSEVYLMLAEAQNLNNDPTGAIATINALLAKRTRAGKVPLTFATYGAGTDLTKFIQLQWRIEMWCEGAREYYNNKRWGIDVDRTTSATHVTKNTRSWQKLTLELPDRELQDNPNTTPNGISGD